MDKINKKELSETDICDNYITPSIYSSGWNFKAIYSLIIGFVFSASTMWNVNLTSLESFGWIIGAFVSYIVYYLLSKNN